VIDGEGERDCKFGYADRERVDVPVVHIEECCDKTDDSLVGEANRGLPECTLQRAFLVDVYSRLIDVHEVALKEHIHIVSEARFTKSIPQTFKFPALSSPLVLLVSHRLIYPQCSQASSPPNYDWKLCDQQL